MTPTVSTTRTASPPTLDLAGTWDLDVAHSRAGFAVRHMMIATVKGTLRISQGTLTYDATRPGEIDLVAHLDAASVDTGVADRDNHLRSADFFDAAAHPTLTFRGARLTPTSQGYDLAGELTIRGVTRPITLHATTPELTPRDPWGNKRAGLSATTTLDRKDWGLTWNVALEAGGLLVADKVRIDLDLQAIRRPD